MDKEADRLRAKVEEALSPAPTEVDELIRQCRAAVEWVHTADLGIDRDRMFVSGHSAGGHIVGMLMAEGWAEAMGLPRDVVKGGCGISGLYELEPIRLTYLNETLGLDEHTAARNSPRLLRPAGAAPPLRIEQP